MTSPDDLPRLLGRPLAALAHEVAAAEVRPGCRLAWWANALRVVDGGPVLQREVRARARVSSRVVTPTLRAFTEWGWVVVEGEPRRKAVRLTDRGEEVAAVWRAVPTTIESRWRSSLGSAPVDRLRAALSALDYEAQDHGAFEIAATVLRHVGDDGRPLVPPLFPAGLDRKAAYTVPRFALGEVVRDRATGTDVLRLSARGRAWRDAYAPTVAGVTDAWRASCGPAVVDEVVDAAAAVAAALPADTPDYPPDT